MNCDEIRDRFSDLMDGELPESASRPLEDHLFSCPACSREWSAFRRAVDAVRGLPQRSAPAGFADSLRESLERERLLASPRPTRVLPLWRRPAFLGKAVAAAAVLLIAVHIMPFPASSPPVRGLDQAKVQGRVPQVSGTERQRPPSGRPTDAPEPPAASPAPPCAVPETEKFDTFHDGMSREQRRTTEPAEAVDANSIALEPHPAAGALPAPAALKEVDKKADAVSGYLRSDADGKDDMERDLRDEKANKADSAWGDDRRGPVLLAWVMPTGDPEAAADRIREALGAPTAEASKTSGAFKAKGAMESQHREILPRPLESAPGKHEGRGEEDARGLDRSRREAQEAMRAFESSARSPLAEEARAKKSTSAIAPSPVRVLSFRVRASDLPGMRSRLAALGARPAPSPEPPSDAARGAADAVALSPAPAGPPKPAGGAKPDGETWVILTILLEGAP